MPFHDPLILGVEAERLIDMVLALLPDASVLVDDDGVITAANEHVTDLFGYTVDELVGQPVETLLPERYRSGHVRQRQGFQAHPHARPMGAGLDLYGRRRDGSEFPVDISLAPIVAGGRNLAVAAVRDVTELKQARRDRELLLLADERGRIARDLHDHAVQSLFATGLSLQSVIPLVDNPRAAERLAEAVDSLDDTIRQIRTAIFTLTAPTAPEAGLRSEVLRLAAEASRGLGFEPTVTFDGAIDVAVPAEVATHVVAVVREALANVARHAHARSVSVQVEVSPHHCEVRVTDDGVGFTPGPRGNGLDNLRSRAEEHGGEFRIEPGREKGTRLTWRVPID